MATFVRQLQDEVLQSGLPTPARHLMLTLCVWADYQTGVIGPEYTRSLTGITAATGLNRRTITRYLDQLETAGWITRHRPPVSESRKGVRAWYELGIGKPELGA